MVAVTRSKIKRPDVSSSTDNQVKDTTPKKLRVKDTTPGSPARVEIPKILYEVITEAASIRGSLRTNKKNKGLIRNLNAKERRVKLLAIYYKATRELPSSWEYNHKTDISTYVPKPSKPLKKKKIKRKIVRLPTIDGTLSEEEQKVWKKFLTKNKRKVHECICIPMEKIGIAVTDPVVNLIHGFAVEAFNDSYHKYVKEHGSKNITQAVPVVCEYYKLTSEYLFYVTIDAIEQGKPGVYEAAVGCDRVTGARTLNLFRFMNHTTKSETSFHQESKYEEAWSSDSSGPDEFYNITGMVHRRRETRGSGFDYHNPSSPLHRYILNDGRKPERLGIVSG